MARKKTKLEKFASRRMRAFKKGQMHARTKKGPVVRTKKQALAIMLDEARRKGLLHGKARKKV
jgi:hypothetical protein